jgi:hypothetical protein
MLSSSAGAATECLRALLLLLQPPLPLLLLLLLLMRLPLSCIAATNPTINQWLPAYVPAGAGHLARPNFCSCSLTPPALQQQHVSSSWPCAAHNSQLS